MSNQDPFESLIAVFDQILVSDNPAVQAALQNLMLLAALSNTSKDSVGPITELFQTIERLKREVDQLRTEVRILSGTRTTPNYPPSYPYQPSWPGDTLRPGTREWDDMIKWGARSQNTSNTTGFTSSSTSSSTNYITTNEEKLKAVLRARQTPKANAAPADKYTSILEKMREKMAKK